MTARTDLLQACKAAKLAITKWCDDEANADEFPHVMAMLCKAILAAEMAGGVDRAKLIRHLEDAAASDYAKMQAHMDQGNDLFVHYMQGRRDRALFLLDALRAGDFVPEV